MFEQYKIRVNDDFHDIEIINQNLDLRKKIRVNLIF